MDIDSGEWLADEISGKVGGVDWLPDSSGFFYRNLADLNDPYSGQIKFHKLGTHERQDDLLVAQRDPSTLFTEADGYTEEDLKRLETTYGPWSSISRDGRWLLVSYATDTRNNDLWVVDLDRWTRTREPIAAIKQPIVVGEQSEAWGPVIGDTLYMKTDLEAPNGRIVAVDLNNPARSNWKEIVPEREDGTLQSISAARGILAVEYLQNASSKIELFSYEGASLGAMPLPGIGSAGVATEEDRTEAFLSFTSYNEPTSIYRVDLATGQRWLWERPDVPVDPSMVEVKQVWYSSKDGTRISMFIIHKKGLKLDGNNPTLLYGYGGFNIPMTPYFSSTLFPWYEAGGVFAVANLRGGGEYGQEWHAAGKLENKQNVFDDFIAAGEWLVENGYTRPEKLACAGGSNGGLLTGAAVTQRPDLFAAVITAVPLLDMVRYHDFLMARYWVPEYGSSEDPEQFEYIFAYSPYQHIEPGTKYPAVLLTAGENDSRVHPLHARKMAAAMQHASASDLEQDPILLRVEREAGHGAGKPLHLRVRDVVDERIFVMWQLGMLESE
jgi:prolyl oligopeptidase